MNEDILNRQPFIDDLLSFIRTLSLQRKGIAFAIDGTWGIGKTFVLQKLEDQLEKEQSEKTNDDRYFVFHYNCWQYDYYDEPAVAIVSAMLEKAYKENETELGTTVKASWKFVKDKMVSIGNEIVKNKIGIDLAENYKEFKAAYEGQSPDYSVFDEWFAFKKTLDDTRKTIKEISADKTIVIVVDELDRCLPDYAIKVLERMHHLFNELDNVIVIYAIDARQLGHAIEKVYGGEISTQQYLRKFISFEVNMNYGEVQDGFWDKYQYYLGLFENKCGLLDDPTVENIVLDIFKKGNILIRDQEKLIEKAFAIHNAICQESKAEYSVLFFEIILLVFTFKAKEIAPREIPLINRSRNITLEQLLGKDLYSYFKELENATSGNTRLVGNITDGDTECKRIINLTFFYFYKLFTRESKFVGRGIPQAEESLRICEAFDRLRKLIK